MKKKMNLYKKYQQNSSRHQAVGKVGTYGVVLFISVLIMAALGFRLMFENSLLTGEIDSLKMTLDNPSNQKKFEEANKISKENEALSTLKESLSEINQVFDKKSGISSQVLIELQMDSPSGVSIEDIDINGSHVTLKFQTKDRLKSSEFVSALKENVFFKSVQYHGYEYNDSNENYTGTVELVLRGNFNE